MRKEKTLFIIGLWIVFLPFLGFTTNIKKVLFFITGLAIIYLAYLFYLENKNRLARGTNHAQTFVDNIDKKE